MAGRDASAGERIAPPQPVESPEIVVRRAKLGPVLNSQGREMSIGREVPAGAERRNQVTYRLQVACGGFGHCDGRLPQPGIHQVERHLDGQRFLKKPWSVWPLRFSLSQSDSDRRIERLLEGDPPFLHGRPYESLYIRLQRDRRPHWLHHSINSVAVMMSSENQPDPEPCWPLLPHSQRLRRAGPFALAAAAPPRTSDVHSGRSGETRFGGPA